MSSTETNHRWIWLSAIAVSVVVSIGAFHRPMAAVVAPDSVPEGESPTSSPALATSTTTQGQANPTHEAPSIEVPSTDGTVSGQVVDEHNRPLVEATVTLYEMGILRAYRQVRTNTDGAFELLGLPVAQTFQLSAEYPGYRGKRIEVRLAQPGATLERTLSLRQGQTLSGHVVDGNGKPVAGALVGTNDDGSPNVRSDEHGAFTLSGLPDHPVNVYAQSLGYATRHRSQVAPGASALTMTLDRPAVIEGSANIPGTVSELLVSACHTPPELNKELCVSRQLLRHPTHTYRLDDLPAGKFDLVVSAAGYPERRHPFTAVAGQTLTGPALDPTKLPPL